MESFLIGFGQLLMHPMSFVLLIAGTMLGLTVGALPGLNSAITMSVLIPVTFGMNPVIALAMLAGIYVGATTGGSVTAILLKVPGTGGAVVTAFDGYEMNKKGKGGLALGTATVSSLFGGIISAIVLCFFAPFLAKQALLFGPPEYFMLAIMGMSSVIGMDTGKMAKSLLSMAIGLMVSIIGISPQGGVSRFTFGSFVLLEGVSMVPMLIGLFGISSILEMLETMGGIRGVKESIQKIKMKLPDRKMIKSFLPIWMQSSIIGNIVGIIPGAGMTVAVFMAYDQAKRTYPHLPFGTGIPEGVAAPEAANNSVTGSSMVPLLSLGIPGNPASAVFLGALMIHGLRTGPSLFRDSPGPAYSLVIAFLIASIMLLPLMIVFCNYMATYVLRLKKEILSSLVLILCVTGAFASGNSAGGVTIAVVFGILGYLFIKFKIPMAPLILADVLGSIMESNWLQSLVLAEGDYSLFVKRPISCFLLFLSIVFLVMPLWKKLKARKI
jgi:putative tricarboxylic transport membrane protein